MTEPPPGRFSTTTCCPRRLAKAPAMTRAAASLPPPGASGTMKRIARSGYCCAEAIGATVAAASTKAAARAMPVAMLDGTRPSSVHVDRDARDHAGARRREEHSAIGDILGLDDASHRHILGELLLGLLGGDAALAGADRDEFGPAAGIRGARADGVHRDAGGAELVRHGLGEVERAEVDRSRHVLHAGGLASARAG